MWVTRLTSANAVRNPLSVGLKQDFSGCCCPDVIKGMEMKQQVKALCV